MDAIEVSGLTKRYGPVTAVDDLTLAVEAGELFGLLGPNGAGKTTLVNTLCTLVTPTAGTATVAGHDVRTDAARVRETIGVVFQEPALDEELTGEENLVFHARLYGITGDHRRERIDEVLDLVDLADRRDEKVSGYSGGMARRLELARGLLHEPEVLFLDEPTVGLDAGTRKAVREYIAALNERTGVTVVLTTHYMEEADALCDRVAIVDRGNVVACNSPSILKHSLGGDLVRLRVSDPDAVTDRLRQLAWVGTVEPTDEVVSIVVDDGERRVPELVVTASEVGDVTGVSVQEPTLERVFLELTGRSVEEAESEPTAASAAGDD
jgi:ABC-2 type transport system ATP-binding protein